MYQIIIDSFYEDVDSVVRELDKLPAAKTEYHCDDVVDLRRSYKTSICGTEFPFTSVYGEVVRNIISYGGKLKNSDEVIVNCNKIQSDKVLTNYYNIHKDRSPLEDAKGGVSDVISTVVMLNDHYNEGEGTSFFYNQEAVPPWVSKDEMELLYFMQGKKNRAIVFSANINHGATYSTDQFKHEYRYSQAIFTELKV